MMLSMAVAETLTPFEVQQLVTRTEIVLDHLIADRDRLQETLQWYEKIVGECNRRGREGDDARNALAQDIGQRARAALQEVGDDE
jgi:hypothetical protein